MNDILLTGTDEGEVPTTIEQLNKQFDTVDLGDTSFLLGMAIQRNVDAGTILLTQEAHPKTVLNKFGMADARPAKTPEPGPIFHRGGRYSVARRHQVIQVCRRFSALT